jgi:hypothetical protein
LPVMVTTLRKDFQEVRVSRPLTQSLDDRLTIQVPSLGSCQRRPSQMSLWTDQDAPVPRAHGVERSLCESTPERACTAQVKVQYRQGKSRIRKFSILSSNKKPLFTGRPSVHSTREIISYELYAMPVHMILYCTMNEISVEKSISKAFLV